MPNIFVVFFGKFVNSVMTNSSKVLFLVKKIVTKIDVKHNNTSTTKF